eukprot:5257-Chlamydomonas_euryale.AAC.6
MNALAAGRLPLPLGAASGRARRETTPWLSHRARALACTPRPSRVAAGARGTHAERGSGTQGNRAARAHVLAPSQVRKRCPARPLRAVRKDGQPARGGGGEREEEWEVRGRDLASGEGQGEEG